MWQELDEPLLYKLDSELAFVIVSEMEFEHVQAGVFLGRGYKFNYENAKEKEVINEGIHIIQFEINEPAMSWEEE